ncbi:hypothetical protein SLS54_009361 [Diplodia seriata]
MTAFERAAERMKAALKQPYQSLQQEEMAVEQKEEHLGRKQGLNPCKAAIACLAVLSWSIFVFEAGTWYPGAETCAMRTSTWSPAQHLIRYAPQAITGSFYQKSPFRGAGDDVDQAWDDVWMQSKNVLRMASYPDHYSNNTFFVDHPAHVVRGHLDHCIEILRMQLQCSAEMAPILTEDGLPGHEFPTADFNVVHMCRNFDDLKEWTRSHILHGAGNWDIPGHGH